MMDFVDLVISDSAEVAKLFGEKTRLVMLLHGSFTLPSADPYFWGGALAYFDYCFASNRTVIEDSIDGIRRFRQDHSLSDRSSEAARTFRRKTSFVPIGNLKFESIVGTANAPPTKKRISIVPTDVTAIETELSLFFRAPELVRRLLTDLPDYVIVFRPYPRLRSHPITQQIVKDFAGEKNFFADLGGGSTNQLYRDTTAMLTDASSGAFSFIMSSGRPAVFYLPQAAIDKFPLVARYAVHCEKYGIVARELREIAPAIRAVEADPESARRRAQDFIDQEIFNPGTAREALQTAIEDILLGTATNWPWV
jgi:hypothetical protein